MAFEGGEFRSELEQLRARLADAEGTLRAIRAGEVDAVIVEGPEGPQVYSLVSAVEPYRLLVEQMGQGALTVSRHGLILFCNDSFARLLDRPRERLVGTRLQDHVAPGIEAGLNDLLETGYEPGRDMMLQSRNGERIDIYVSAAPLAIGGEEVRCLVVTDLSQQELRRRHAVVVESSQDAIYALDSRFVIQTWNGGAEALTGLFSHEAIGRPEWDLWPPDHRGDLERLISQVRQTGAAGSIDTVRLHRDGARIDLMYTLTPIKGRDGQPTGYSVIAHDITERKEAEQRLRFLTAEIDHRGKNLLATVQAIATLSGRGVSSVDDFLATFAARIRALAATHVLLSDGSWGGAAVHDVAGAALAGFIDDQRIRIEGCEAVLKPKPAQDLALCLHELLTNAVKYGALSVGQGSVELRWRRDDERLAIDWRELDGPKVSPPARQGLGSRVIRQAAGAGGRVDHAFAPEGVRCRIDLPPDALRS